MGREAETVAQWQGQTAEVRALLETTEIILRGGIRARIARADITGKSVEDGWLTIGTRHGPLVLELAEAEAARWLAALQKPVPTLAQKLGVAPEHRAFVTGVLEDTELAAALQGAIAPDLDGAKVIVAVLENPDDLTQAFALAQSAPHLALWCVYPKGKSAVTDAVVRDYLRGRGYIDSKSCAVSDRLTATRYAARKT